MGNICSNKEKPLISKTTQNQTNTNQIQTSHRVVVKSPISGTSEPETKSGHSKVANNPKTVVSVIRVKSVKGVKVRESIIASTEPAGVQNFLYPTSDCTYEKHIVGVSEI